MVPVTCIFANRHRYVAHPHMAALPNGEWVIVANRGPRRDPVLHPPHDPDFCNILLRSADQGHSWSAPVAIGEPGTECAGLTVLPDGTLLLNQWRFRWYPSHERPTRDEEPLLADAAELRRERFGSTELDRDAALIEWARGGGTATVRHSADGGRHFGAEVHVDVGSYCGGYGMRGGAVLQDGSVLLPLSDAPRYRQVFAVRSRDDGQHWEAPQPVAAAQDREFEEPAPIVLTDGAVLLLLRDNVSHTLFSVRSEDAGRTWSKPLPTGIDGYPAHVLALPDGRLAAIVGCRTPPFRIAAFFSGDQGRSWGGEPVTIASPSHRDLGYPTAALCKDGRVFVAWYQRDADGVTGLHGSHALL